MDLSKIMELRAALDAESISYGELAEIDEAFEREVNPATLNEPAENAMAGDKLDELERLAVYTCVNCHAPNVDDVGECFGHPDAEPGWPRFHTRPYYENEKEN